MLLESAIGALGGAITGLLTKVLDIKDKKAEREHEFKMTSLQLQIDQARSQQAIEETRAQGEVLDFVKEWETLQAAAAAQGQLTGNKWIDGLTQSVRPVLTYWWCIFLYTAYKIPIIWMAWGQKVDLETFARTIVTDFDGAVISAIIGFWFVSRQLMRYNARGRTWE